MSPFKDKVAIVTGAASGIGRALCNELSLSGAILFMADINADSLRQAVAEINRSGGRAVAAPLDVTRAEEVQALVDQAIAAHGHLDYMFNNAGIGVAGEVRDLSLDHWRRIIDVNLWGVIYGASAAYRAMVKQGSGHIVNTASLAGLIGSPAMTPYSTTKFAVLGLSTSLRAEGEGLGVKVSAVCPGLIQTGIFAAGIYVNTRQEDIEANVPFKMLTPDRAAHHILRGVARNRAIIVFPFYARFTWWLHRINQSLTMPLARKLIKDFRAIRTERRAKGSSSANH